MIVVLQHVIRAKITGSQQLRTVRRHGDLVAVTDDDIQNVLVGSHPGPANNESTVYRPGNSIDSYLVGGHRVGYSICYDLRFPELYLKLAQQGVQVIVVPAAFTLQTGKDHWEVLCRARAIEAQAYVLAANQYGRYEEEGIMRANYGNSLVVDPWGKVIARAQDKACYISAELDFDYLAEVRSNLPSLRHRVLATGER